MSRLARIPLRVVSGAYLIHTGWDHWRANEKTAAGLHYMASTAMPPLQRIPAPQFARALSAAELGIGASLLLPTVPAAAAGAALGAFASGLMTVYARFPGLRRPGSVLPSRDGVSVSKDVWLLGIALALVLDRR